MSVELPSLNRGDSGTRQRSRDLWIGRLSMILAGIAATPFESVAAPFWET